jgi:hypothetical protein
MSFLFNYNCNGEKIDLETQGGFVGMVGWGCSYTRTSEGEA